MINTLITKKKIDKTPDRKDRAVEMKFSGRALNKSLIIDKSLSLYKGGAAAPANNEWRIR